MLYPLPFSMPQFNLLWTGSNDKHLWKGYQTAGFHLLCSMKLMCGCSCVYCTCCPTVCTEVFGKDHRSQLVTLICLQCGLYNSVRFWWWCVTFGIILYGLFPPSHVTNNNTNKQTTNSHIHNTFTHWSVLSSFYLYFWSEGMDQSSSQNMAFYF